jgi:hypothetical protein
MPIPETGTDPFWNTDLGRRTARHQEVVDLVRSLTPAPDETEELPAGHFNSDDVPEHEVAAYLNARGSYGHRYRTEH